MKIKSSKPMGITLSGKFITRIARKKYWVEDRPYTECEEFVLGCMEYTSEERPEIRSEIFDVIMGRKKLVGKEEYETVEEEGIEEKDEKTVLKNLLSA